MQPILNNVSSNSHHKVHQPRANFQRKTSAEIISEAKSMLAGGKSLNFDLYIFFTVFVFVYDM